MWIAICDEELECRKYCIKLINAFSRKHNIDIKIVEYENGKELLFALENEEIQINLLYLEISVSDENGLLIAKEIREKEYDCEMIFFTRLDSCWREAFYVRALYYLIKEEFSEEEFEKTFLFGVKEVLKKAKQYMIFKCAGELKKIAIADILYFEVYVHSVIVHYQNNLTFKFYTSLNRLQTLLANESFIRCHKSYLISILHIESIVKNEIKMKDGNIVPIGRMYRDDIRRKLLGQSSIILGTR
jgi:Response regulator of the LytR/AlgR family